MSHCSSDRQPRAKGPCPGPAESEYVKSSESRTELPSFVKSTSKTLVKFLKCFFQCHELPQSVTVVGFSDKPGECSTPAKVRQISCCSNHFKSPHLPLQRWSTSPAAWRFEPSTVGQMTWHLSTKWSTCNPAWMEGLIPGNLELGLVNSSTMMGQPFVSCRCFGYVSFCRW